jgi:hypothetical protein
MKNKKCKLNLIRFSMLLMVSLSAAHGASAGAGASAAFEDAAEAPQGSYRAPVD